MAARVAALLLLVAASVALSFAPGLTLPAMADAAGPSGPTAPETSVAAVELAARCAGLQTGRAACEDRAGPPTQGIPPADSVSTERSPRPFIGRAAARKWMRVALGREFGGNWTYGVFKRTECRKRISRNRVRCTRISWAVGDLVFSGSGTVWYTRADGAVWWNYAYRIKRVNEYCVFVYDQPLRKCSKTFVVR